MKHFDYLLPLNSVRIILGIYLCIHFIMLVPYAAELWSAEGIFPDAYTNLTYGFIPNIFSLISTPSGVEAVIVVLLLLSLLLISGCQRNLVSLLLWYGWICLLDRNNLILNPGIPYVGWILLILALLPNAESKKGFLEYGVAIPNIVKISAIFILGMGYTLSGIDKLGSPSWVDGSAFFHLLNNPLARDSFIRDFLLELPMIFHKLSSYIVLAVELLSLPLFIYPKTRKWIWLILVVFHISILTVIDFADLTIGMLMIHLFTFDIRWFKKNR